MFNFLKAGAKPEVRREKREKKKKKVHWSSMVASLYTCT
jgi:hypothetical protein